MKEDWKTTIIVVIITSVCYNSKKSSVNIDY